MEDCQCQRVPRCGGGAEDTSTYAPSDCDSYQSSWIQVCRCSLEQCCTTSCAFSFSGHTRRTGRFCCSRMDNVVRLSSRRGILEFFRLFFVNAFLLNRTTIFLLVIVIHILSTTSSPVHTRHHRHFDHVDLPRCDDKGRFRRHVEEMDLKDGRNSSVCPYRACIDKDVHRRPVHITRVECLGGATSSCSKQGGAYHCVQLYTDMEVWVRSEGDGNAVEVWHGDREQRMTSKWLRVEYGCVCAAKLGEKTEALRPEIVT